MLAPSTSRVSWEDCAHGTTIRSDFDINYGVLAVFGKVTLSLSAGACRDPGTGTQIVDWNLKSRASVDALQGRIAMNKRQGLFAAAAMVVSTAGFSRSL